MSRMSFKKIPLSVKIIILILLVFSIILFVIANKIAARSRSLHDEGTELILLSNEVLHNNDYLIKLMRNFVATGDREVLQEYETILNDYNSLDGMLDKMLEIGLSDDEQKRVEQIRMLWDGLAAIENTIIEAYQSGDEELAFSIAFGVEYAKADKEIANEIKLLINDIVVRTQTDNDKMRDKEQMVLFAIGIFLAIIVTGGLVVSATLTDGKKYHAVLVPPVN